METKLKILTALTIPYAFFCAGLYQIAYWLPFNINGFSYLSISDIIMSFIHPFLYTSFVTIFFYVVNYYIFSSILPHGGGNAGLPSANKRRLWNILKGLYIVTVISCLTFLDTSLKSHLLPFLLLPGLYFAISEFLLKNDFMKHEKLRFVVLYSMVMLPVFSFYTGTRNAYDIYDNKKYDYSILVVPNDTLKFLGKASNYYMFISIDNKDKYFFSTDEIKRLKLNEHKSR